MNFRKDKWKSRSLCGRYGAAVTMSISVISHPCADSPFTVIGVNFPGREIYGSWIFLEVSAFRQIVFRQSLFLHLLIVNYCQLKICFMSQWCIPDAFITVSQLALGKERMEGKKVLIVFLVVINLGYFTFIVFLRGFLIIPIN